MTDPNYDLQSPNAWARSAFPDDFAIVEEYVKPGAPHGISFERRAFISSAVLTVLRIGFLHFSTTEVFAAIGVSGAISAHHPILPGYPGRPAPLRRTHYQKFYFLHPFAWLKPAEDDASRGRFEAFVNYLFLSHSKQHRQRIKPWSEWGELFKDACRVIAHEIRCKKQNTEPPAVINRHCRFSYRGKQGSLNRVTDLITVDDAKLPDSPSLPHSEDFQLTISSTVPVAAQIDRLLPVDQAFATFRAGLAEQLNATQEGSRLQCTVLEAQVEDLETKIMDVETEREKLNNERVKAKSEAEKWKAQYEGLRKAMQDVVERHF